MANKPIPTPLMADLPTNWTRGQIVAPTGQEVGLPTNYGYNYLMAKVNEARTAINTINDAFTNLPDANTLAQYLKLSGGTMTGNITMSREAKVTGLPTPTENADAVPKNYVDQQLSQNLAQYLKLSGGTMTGNITMSGDHTVKAVPTPTENGDATPKSYVDSEIAKLGEQMNGDLQKYLPLSGGTMTGQLNMGSKMIRGLAKPVTGQDAANKDYVDETIAKKGKWSELERITASKTWTVPAGVYRIGVFLLGAGASGEATGISRPSSSFNSVGAKGGSSGWGLSVVLDVTPGQTFNVVIGAGGVATDSSRSPGGDTKFGSYIALGGQKENHAGYGAQDCTALYWWAIGDHYDKTNTSIDGPYGGITGNIGTGQYSDTTYYTGWVSLAAPNEKNVFDPTMKLFGLGGGVSAYWGASRDDPSICTIVPADLGDMGRGGKLKIINKGTDGTTYYGEDATGYGNGGGAILSLDANGTFRGGPGSQGLVIIYT